MMDKFITRLRKYPLFLYLLPVFFVLHGSMENYDFVPLKDALMLTGLYLLFAILFFILFRLIYKNWMKAALIAFLIMALHFFFGTIQDSLRHLFPRSFITKWIFIVPFFICLLVAAFITLKKRKNISPKLPLYLNVLFILLIIIDGTLLFNKSINYSGNNNELPKDLIYCANCPKPDIYLIIADEYPGNTELKDLFKFDNAEFLDQLTQRGFHIIPNSRSNYNYTPYSVASTLNMDYLNLDRRGKQPLLAYTYETIGQNRFLQFLRYHKYNFYNYSLSDFKGYPAHVHETFLPVNTKLITSQTFLSRLNKELGFHWIMASKKAIEKNVYSTRENNNNLSRLLVHTTIERTSRPKFVLTHLMMPHYPYFYDKNENAYPFELIIEGNQVNQHNFIEYLQYSNKKLLALIDAVLHNSAAPPIVILMGDHGFRHFITPVDTRYYFTNLVSVHLPGGNYSAFTDSLSNVNLLRAVLNTAFAQRMPYLKDTSFVMDNP